MKNIFDSASKSDFKVAVLISGNNLVGKIIWKWSKSGLQTWCSIVIYDRTLKTLPIYNEKVKNSFSSTISGSASGGGYDKAEASFRDCLEKNGVKIETSNHIDYQNFFSEIGLTCENVF